MQIEKLFELYEQKMYQLALRILKEPWDAEDAVIEAFTRILKAGYDLEPEGSDQTKRMIITITKSAAIDIYRKRRGDITGLMDPEILEEYPSSERSDEDRIQAEQLVQSLPDKYAKVLMYRFLKDKSLAQTARILKISEAAVSKRQERAIEMLRKRSDIQ